MRKYSVPSFLSNRVDQKKYEHWLRAKAKAHSRRDVDRLGQKHSGERYRDLIHAAVCASDGKDFYTGEQLQWEMISTYNNEESQTGKTKYKSKFALLPSVDHVHKEDGTHDFVICSWRVNDMKSDLSLHELLDRCERILLNHGYSVDKPMHD